MVKWIGFVLLGTSLVACAATPEQSVASSKKKGTANDASGTFGAKDDGDPNAPTTPGPAGSGEVWGQSSTTLYRLDPSTKAVTVVGQFSGCGPVLDIALDASSQLIATTTNGLFKVDKATAACTVIQNGQYPNSLSFVPAGTVDPNKEALVGYLESSYVRIDPSTGVITTIGQLGGGLQSSGDIVSVKGGATYLTVTGTGCETSDCLIEVDPKSGAMLKNWGPVGRSEVFGLAFWAGSVYGFDSAGELFEVSFAAGKLATKTIPMQSSPGLQFWGAGSTTSAPVAAVN